jgi:AraC-like DNA-binding protein
MAVILRKKQNTVPKMQNTESLAGGMPLIRLSLISPFIAELDRRQIKCMPLLREVGFPTQRPICNELFVSSNLMYRFVNLAAAAADDRYLGARVGYGLNPKVLPQYSQASEEALTVADLLVRIAINSEHHNTSVKMGLNIDSNWAVFNFVRVFEPDVDASQLDAYYVGVFVNVLKTALQSTWNPRQVIASLHNPDAIPPDLERIGLSNGKRHRVSITFPSKWLFEWVNPTARAEDSRSTQELPAPPRTLVDSLKIALEPHIHEPDLTVERSANICGFEKRRLSRKLKAKGTTMARLIANIREERAASELAETDRKIGEIAQTVGFKDPAVFSRAFKNWTGQSPQAYRRNHR